MPKIAVGLSGLIRTFDQSVDSLKRRVVDVHQADVFVFAPDLTDAPDRHHGGRLDPRGLLVHDSKNNLVGETRRAEASRAEQVLGSSLKGRETYPFDPARFAWSESVAPEELIFSIKPARFCSMFYNLRGVCRMILAHEAQTGERYDYVILARPDLVYFNALTFEPFAPGRVYIPRGSGTSNWKGFRNRENAPVFFYENIPRGICIPGLTHKMNDQLLVLHRDDLPVFEKLYDELPTLFAERIPLNPEAILYTWLTGFNDLAVIENDHWFYTIFRDGMPLVRNLTDLDNIVDLDPSNLKAMAYARKFPGKMRLKRWRARLHRFLARVRGT